MKQKRQSISIPAALHALLDSGQLGAHRSLPDRLDILARRYSTLVSSSLPATLSIAQWSRVTQHAATIDLSHPAAHMTLVAAARADKTDTRLGYTLEQAGPVTLYAIISVAEQILAQCDPLTDDVVGAWLDRHQVPVAKLST